MPFLLALSLQGACPAPLSCAAEHVAERGTAVACSHAALGWGVSGREAGDAAPPGG